MSDCARSGSSSLLVFFCTFCVFTRFLHHSEEVLADRDGRHPAILDVHQFEVKVAFKCDACIVDTHVFSLKVVAQGDP